MPDLLNIHTQPPKLKPKPKPKPKSKPQRRIPRTGPACGIRRNSNSSTRRLVRPTTALSWAAVTVDMEEFIVLGCERRGTAGRSGGSVEELEMGVRGLDFRSTDLEEETMGAAAVVCRMPWKVSEYERVLAQRGYRLFERYVVGARMAGDLAALNFGSPLAVFTDSNNNGKDGDHEWFLLFLNDEGEVVEYGGVCGRAQNLGKDFEMGWYVSTVGLCRAFLPLPRL